MLSIDHARRRIVVTPAQLGLLAAAAGGAEGRLAGRPEAAAVRAELERAGLLGERAPRWAGELAAVVARPRARVEVDERRPGASDVAYRAWAGDEHGVVGREASEGRMELAVVPRGLVVLALVRALGLRARPVRDEALELPAGALEEALPVRAAWRFSSSLSDETLTVVDAAEQGLWAASPLGEDRVRLAPAAIEPLLARLAAMLGAQPLTSSR